MKVQIRLTNLEASGIREIKYFLGPCADDGYILDPRDELTSSKKGPNNDLTITVVLPEGTTTEDVARAVEHLAFSIGKRQ